MDFYETEIQMFLKNFRRPAKCDLIVQGGLCPDGDCPNGDCAGG